MRVSARHEGDLNNQLTPFSSAHRTTVTLILDQTASLISIQHTAWMLANLAVRLDGYVEQLSISCPAGIATHPNVIPFGEPDSDLSAALVSAAKSLGIVPVTTGTAGGIELHLGPGQAPAAGWRVYGDGWCGGITKAAIHEESKSGLPFGPYIAACFAAAEVFKQMRVRREHYSPSEGFYDAWNLQPSGAFVANGPAALCDRLLECTLAGVGAVGNAFLHTMLACPSLQLTATLADNDKKGLDATNLNRYVLFGKNELGKLKPDATSALLNSSRMRLTPWNDAAENLPTLSSRVLSAVDKNTSREGIQFRYPARIFSASTSDLRAEVLRCGPPAKGACLRCYNPPEALPPDTELIARLQKASPEELARFCATAGVSVADCQTWLKTRKCGEAGERLISVLREEDGADGAFAVGFTSVLAGTLLAVEFIKDCFGLSRVLADDLNRCTFQFFEVLSPANRSSFLPIDPKCPICDSKRRSSLRVWQKRFADLGPQRG